MIDDMRFIVRATLSGIEMFRRSASFLKGKSFVIVGFIPGTHGIDSIIVGYYRGKDLLYVARTRNGFVPGTRASGVRHKSAVRPK